MLQRGHMAVGVLGGILMISDRIIVIVVGLLARLGSLLRFNRSSIYSLVYWFSCAGEAEAGVVLPSL